MSQTPEQLAMGEATVAARKVIAQSKDARTVLGKMKPTSVAYHVAYVSVVTYGRVLEHERARRDQRLCSYCGRAPQTGGTE